MRKEGGWILRDATLLIRTFRKGERFIPFEILEDPAPPPGTFAAKDGHEM